MLGIISRGLLALTATVGFAVSCVHAEGLSDETRGKLQSTLVEIRSEIQSAEKQDQELIGGLVKALLQARLEILRTTEAVIQQRLAADQAGSAVKVEMRLAKPDPERAFTLMREIEAKKAEIAEADADVAKYSGGLVHAMKSATVATHQQSLAMLEQEYLIAKYGLGFPTLRPSLPSTTSADTVPVDRGSAHAAPQGATASKTAIAIVPVVGNKRLTKLRYEEYVLFDIVWQAGTLVKPTRAIKGVLVFADLFGEPKLKVGVTIDDPMTPGGSLTQKGIGFEYNQFREEPKWMTATDLSNMAISLEVSSIIYQDGERVDF